MPKKPKLMSRPPDRRWVDELATYNAERARGLVHTPEWAERMAVLQSRFDEELIDDAKWHAEKHACEARQRINLK